MSNRVALMLSFFLAFPLLASATSSTFQNTGGQITSNGNTLTLSGSSLSALNLNGTAALGNLGSVNFTTGALISGSLAGGGTFAAGGSFMISGNGANGIPSGLLFQGTFSQPVAWTAIWNPTGDHGGDWTYELSGKISGTLANGQKFSANLIAYTFDVPKGGEFSSTVRFKDGVASTAVPEPGTLAMLGTGLVGLGMLGFRKRSPTR